MSASDDASFKAAVRANREKLRQGDIDGAVADRHELLRQIKHSDPSSADGALARAQCATLFLVNVERNDARASLEPYLNSDNRPDLGVINAIREGDPSSKGLLAYLAITSTLADSLFRLKDDDKARRLIDLCLKAFPETNTLLESEDWKGSLFIRAVILRIRSEARAARISWRTGRRGGSSRNHLRKAVHDLEVVWERLSEAERISLDAYLMDLWASLDWTLGRQAQAQAKAFRALYQLERGIVRDSSRAAHARFTAARVLSTVVTGGRYRLALDLLDGAHWPSESAIRPQALILRSQILIKAGRTTDALTQLEEVESTRSSLDSSQAADLDLAWAWFLRRTSDAEGALKAVERILSMPARGIKLQRRHRIEANIQHGLVLIEHGDASAAIGALEQALDESKRHARRKSEVACFLGLAQAHNHCGDSDKAHIMLKAADRLMRYSKSEYLADYRSQVAKELMDGSLFLQLGDSHSYEDFIVEVRKQYADQLLKMNDGNQGDAAREAGVHHTTLWRMINRQPFNEDRGGSVRRRKRGGAARTRGGRRDKSPSPKE